jgi:hypothetical protein
VSIVAIGVVAGFCLAAAAAAASTAYHNISPATRTAIVLFAPYTKSELA